MCVYLNSNTSSHCEEHDWLSRTILISANKHSIFEDDEEAENQQITLEPFYKSSTKKVFIDAGGISIALEEFFMKKGWRILRRDQSIDRDFHFKWLPYFSIDEVEGLDKECQIVDYPHNNIRSIIYLTFLNKSICLLLL